MAFTINRHESAAGFAGRAFPWLLEREAEHNLLIGLAGRLQESPDGYDTPVYLASVEGPDAVVGCAFRAPPHGFGLTRMPMSAVAPLVRDVSRVYETLPSVLGPEGVGAEFARLWGEQAGVSASPKRRQRIYQLSEVLSDTPLPSGAARLASPADLAVLADWIHSFEAEIGFPHHRPGMVVAEEKLRRNAVTVWDDRGIRSMAALASHTPNGVRISFVYTPPEWRGRGYASACVSALSRRALAAGRQFCFLYTDLANPTSNSIYQRMGYRAVCDVVEYEFEGRGRD